MTRPLAGSPADTSAGAASGPGPGTGTGSRRARLAWLSGVAGRNLGLVVALLLICVIGVATGGDRFADIDNVMTILRLAAITGVMAVGMTFVITTGGIDLSVGSVLGLATVWATTLSAQAMAADVHWIVTVLTALAVGTGAGLVNGLLIAFGKVVPFIATLAMLASARGLAELISNRQTQRVQSAEFVDVFTSSPLGVPFLVWIFAAVSVAGWVLLNRTTFGRRTVAIGGNAEASRLAGIGVSRHLLWIYALSGLTAGIGAVMMLGRTTAGTSTHGALYELDVIAAVVVGGTLLIGGRGTIVGTVFGVLIFSVLNNIFTINNMTTSAQLVAKGAIIVAAVLLQQRLAGRSKST